MPMTPGMIVLLLFIGWIAIAIAAGKFAYKGTKKRWKQVLTVLFVLWLPFWDVLPGWIMYQKAVREMGGVRIKRTVEAEGYLDRTLPHCSDCWTRLNSNGGYHYIEVFVANSNPQPGSLTATPGYYEFRYESAGSNQCVSLENLTNADRIQKRIPPGRCLVVIRRDVPTSQYEKLSGRSPYHEVKFLPTIWLSWNMVRNRLTDETIAEAYRVHYKSWLGKTFMFPQWNYISSSTGQPLYFEIQDVIKPIGVPYFSLRNVLRPIFTVEE